MGGTSRILLAWLLGVLAGVPVLVATGCHVENLEFETKHRRTKNEASSTLPLLERLAAAPDELRFQGVRRYEAHYTEQDQAKSLIYRERVSCDGQGAFALELLEVLAPTSGLDHGLFLLLHEVRAGFVHRYRDFRVHDLDALLENYEILDTGTTLTVAGRECARLELRRGEGAERVWHVAVDLQSGLALSVREESREGDLLALSEYESLDLAPDLSGVTFRAPLNEEQPLPGDPAAAAALLGFEPDVPRFVPDGWRPIESSVVRDPSTNRRWAKRTYTDGVETLLFLHGGKAQPQWAPATATGAGDEARAGTIGAWNVLQARLGGELYLGLGKQPITLLSSVVQSAAE